MKYSMLIFLLLFFAGSNLFGQSSRAKEIVSQVLKKHTSGKNLSRYAVKINHDRPGKIPNELYQKNPLEIMLDSLMPTFPDSLRKSMEMQMRKSKEENYERWNKDGAEKTEWVYADVELRKASYISVAPNQLKGTTDSTKYVYGNDKLYPSFWSSKTQVNPIAVLQMMTADTTELNYTGSNITDGREHHILQVKMGGKWIDVFIDKQLNYLTRIVEPLIDTDPLIGQGPVHYQQIMCYKEFQDVNGFLLPGIVEEMTTTHDLTTRKRLSWFSLNETLPESVFVPGPTDEESIKFRFVDIGNGLQVMEQSGRYQNKRSLIRINEGARFDLFIELFNNENVTNKMLVAMERSFPKFTLSKVFNINYLHGINAQAAFFAKGAHLFAPKNKQEMRRVYNGKFENDSLWNKMHDAGLLTIFNKEFLKDSVQAIMLDKGIVQTCYYLPADKVIYFSGTAYAAVGWKDAAPYEKWLYDLIKDKNINVEKLVYSGAYMDNAPPFMPFQEFEKRVLQTDFSKYEPFKK